MCGGFNKMGKTIGLTAYSICVRDDSNNQYELHDILGNSLIEYLESIGKTEKDKYKDDQVKENLFAFNEVKVEKRVNENNQALYDILYIRIKTGEYGEESEIVARKSGKVTHVKGDDEADVMPFGFSIIVPSGKYTGGVIMLQSLGRNGIVSIVKEKLNQYIKLINNQLRVVMNPILPKHYINQFLNKGILKSIRLVRYIIPEEDAEAYGINAGVEQTIEERIIKNPVGFVANKCDALKEVIEGKRKYDEVIEIKDFETNDLKLEFKMGRRLKTVSMKNLDALVVNEDITDEVKIEKGHPTFESLCKIMDNSGYSYLIAMGFLEE
jgi:hypothetical protein